MRPISVPDRFLAIDATQPVVTNHHQHIFTKNEFEHHHHTERAPHGGVTPEQALHLIMGLKDQKNRWEALSFLMALVHSEFEVVVIISAVSFYVLSDACLLHDFTLIRTNFT